MIGDTLSRVPCGSGSCLRGSGEQDTVGSVVAVSDPMSMNWWARIKGLIFGPELGCSRHLLDDAGQHGLKVCVLATAGWTWMWHRYRGGWRRWSGNRRGTNVTAASLRQLGLRYLQLALRVVNDGAKIGRRSVMVRADWRVNYQSRRHLIWPNGASAYTCRWRAACPPMFEHMHC